MYSIPCMYVSQPSGISWYVVVKFSEKNMVYLFSVFICSVPIGMTSMFLFFPKCDAEGF